MLTDRIPVIRARRDRSGRIRQPQSHCCGGRLVYVPVGTNRRVLMEGDLWLDQIEPAAGIVCLECGRPQRMAGIERDLL